MRGVRLHCRSCCAWKWSATCTACRRMARRLILLPRLFSVCSGAGGSRDSAAVTTRCCLLWQGRKCEEGEDEALNAIAHEDLECMSGCVCFLCATTEYRVCTHMSAGCNAYMRRRSHGTSGDAALLRHGCCFCFVAKLGRVLPRNCATATLRSPGRVRNCGRSAPEKRKKGTSVTKTRRPFSDHHPCVQASRGPVFGSVFWAPFFSAGAPKGNANAAFARRVSSGRRSPALKKPRRTFQRRDQRAIH